MAELATADPFVLSVGFLAVPVAFLCWTETFRTLLAGTGTRVGGRRYRAAYLSGEFAKQVIPMGQAGGPVLLSYAISSQTDSPYQGTLAAASVFTLLNITASLVVVTGGLAVYLLTRHGPLEPVLVGLLGGPAVGCVATATLAAASGTGAEPSSVSRSGPHAPSATRWVDSPGGSAWGRPPTASGRRLRPTTRRSTPWRATGARSSGRPRSPSPPGSSSSSRCTRVSARSASVSPTRSSSSWFPWSSSSTSSHSPAVSAGSRSPSPPRSPG